MRLGLIALAFVLLLVASARAQEWNLYTPCADAGLGANEREFLQESGQCDPSHLAVLRDLFQAPPIADVAGEGGQAVRVFVTDGYGHKIVVVEAVRAAGSETARAIARGRSDDSGRLAPTMREAELEADAWDAIVRRAQGQARVRAAPPTPAWRVRPTSPEAEEEPIVVCLHGWSVTIETVGFGQPRVLARNSCDDRVDESFDFGWRTISHVFDAFPGCDRLDPQFHRNDAARLAFCLALTGDIGVAASAANVIEPFLDGALVHDRLRYLLADDFTLTLDGDAPLIGADAALARWRAYVAAGDYQMGYDGVEGSSHNDGRQRAQFALLLFDDANAAANETRFAEVAQSWTFEQGVWVMHAMSIGPWQTFTWPDDD